MTLTPLMYVIVCPLAMLAGFIDSVAGGGGLISLPAYYLAGLPPLMAAGTNKLSASLGAVTAAFQFARGKQIIFGVALPAALAALPGSYLGALLLQHIPEKAIQWMMIGVIPLVAAVVLRKKEVPQPVCHVPTRWLWAVSLLTGLVIGFYDGLVGPGTGTFLILIFNGVLGLDMVKASGSAKIVNLASNVAALINLLFAGQVLIALGLPAAAFAMGGAFLGSRMTMRRGAGFIRIMLFLALALLLAKMLYDVLT